MLLFSFFLNIFLCQGYELSGEIALKNKHYYYYYYYSNKLDKVKADNKETWRVLNEILNRKKNSICNQPENYNDGKHIYCLYIYIYIYIYIYTYIMFACTSGRCNRQSEFTLLHFTIFH